MKIRIINPNTTRSMTDKIGHIAQSIASPGTQIVATQPDSGPRSIESHFDETVSAVGVLDEIIKGEHDCTDAYIIACFGDPALLAARELTTAPVLGIAEAAFHVASFISTKFSIVTTLGRTRIIAEELLKRYGFYDQCAKIRAAEIPVLTLEHDPDAALRLIIEECRRAKEEDQIGAIVLGCGGMADLTEHISQEIQLPVIEGVSAAIKLAESLVGLRVRTSKFGDLAFPNPKEFQGVFAHYSASASMQT